jgi:tetratricopeptide (TPR) repeat protein
MFQELILADQSKEYEPKVWFDKASEVLSFWRDHLDLKTEPEELVNFFEIYTNVVRKVSELQDIELKDKEPTYNDNKVRIVLNSIMKNEQPVMSRSIKSALPIIDAMCYSDTGSTGDVFEILREIVPPSLPLCVEIEPWRNFGYNRTAGLDQTSRFVRRMGWNPKTTFILCIDADMTLCVTPAFVKENLSADCYNLQQHNGSVVYWNNRILKVANQWSVVGRTHEYYTSKIPASYENLTTLNLDDRNDGMNRSDKFARDIVLLMEDLIENPKNQRSMFYLGESYRNRGNKEKGDYQRAISYYEKHIATGSWEEEMWYSHYAIGLCYESLGDTPKMLHAFMEAYQRRPWRAEPLFHIANHYRHKNNHWSAMLYFKRAVDMPFPNQDSLFVDKHVYNYQIPYEMSISAYYVGDKEVGYKCVQKLLRRKNVPDNIQDQTYYNARFYIKALPNTEFSVIKPNIESPYKPCNPSLCIRGSDLIINCRSVNYTQNKARNYKPPEGSDIFHTQNTLMICDTSPNLKCKTEKPMINDVRNEFVETCKVRGMEDVRIVNLGNGKLACSCTSLEHTSNNLPHMVWVDFLETKTACIVERIRLITGYENHLIQKNWLPFVVDGEVFFIYGYEPFTILKLDQTNCTVSVHRQFHIPIHAAKWRGSTGPVHIPGYGNLILVHEVCHRDEGRAYMHRFVLLDETMTSFKSASDIFFFKHNEGVEMAVGMVYIDGNIYISIGVEDHEAWLVKTPFTNVKNFINNAQCE